MWGLVQIMKLLMSNFLRVLYDSQCIQWLFPWTALTNDLYTGDVLSFLWGMDWILKYYLQQLRFKG
jgi:hypothetical protein